MKKKKKNRILYDISQSSNQMQNNNQSPKDQIPNKLNLEMTLFTISLGEKSHNLPMKYHQDSRV